MRIAFLADLHVGNHRKWGLPSRGTVAPINTRAADIIRVLTQAKRKAEAERVSDLFVLGDIFDTSSPSPQLVAEVQSALVSRELVVHMLVGNHDAQSDQRGDHALVSMDGHRNIRVYDKPDIVYPQTGGPEAVWMVPYRPGNADDYLPALVKDMGPVDTRAVQVLALHLGLRDASTATWLQNAHDSFPVARRHELGAFTAIMAGNWHERKELVPNVWQIGALVPTGFDNPGFDGYGSLLLLDTASTSMVKTHVMDGPRFVRTLGMDQARKALNKINALSPDWPVYLSVRCRLDEREAVKELCELYDHQTYEILTDRAVADEAVRAATTAASTAGSTEGIQAAVRAYVDRMALPEDIVRSDVLSRALDYVAGAGA